jgi:transcriptional regulator with XRE-family HTH domain
VELSQRDLAARAGIRVETLCRIETGKHIPSVPTIDKLDRALKQAARDQELGKQSTRVTHKAREVRHPEKRVSDGDGLQADAICRRYVGCGGL